MSGGGKKRRNRKGRRGDGDGAAAAVAPPPALRRQDTESLAQPGPATGRPGVGGSVRPPPPLRRQDTETVGVGASSGDDTEDEPPAPLPAPADGALAAPGARAINPLAGTSVSPRSAAAALPAAGGDGDERLPLTAEQMISMARVGAAAVSPDGTRAAVAVCELGRDAAGGQPPIYSADADEDSLRTFTTRVYLVPLGDGAGAPRPLTNAYGKSDSEPVWLDDATVAFLSNRSGSSQVWCISVLGGEARQLTAFPLPLADLGFNRHRSLLSFSCRVLPGRGMRGTAEADEQRKKRRSTEKHFTHLPVRHWDTWDDGKRAHVFLQALQRADTGQWFSDSDFMAVDVMEAAGIGERSCPVPPFGGSEHYDVSPDGDEMAVTVHAHEGASERAWTTNTQVLTVSLGWRVSHSTDDGGSVDAVDVGRPALASGAGEGYDSSPSYSPDGRWLAFLSMRRPGYEADRQRVMLVARGAGAGGGAAEPRELLPEASWPHSAAGLVWAHDSASLLVQAEVKARVKYFSAPVPGGDGVARLVVDTTHATGLAVRPCGGGLVYGVDSMTTPTELWASGPGGERPRQLTRFHSARLSRLLLSEPEELWFEGANGDRVHAWFLPPSGRDERPGARYPLVSFLHGGPQGAWSQSWHRRWNMQVLATHGYAALAVNFHGSSSFGQEFTDSINRNWGGAPFEDVERGLAHALERYPWVDAGRVGAVGASYGGYMINWLLGHAGDRYRCFVNHAGIYDLRSMFSTTEELFFVDHEFGGAPWDVPEEYERWSPSAAVKKWKTPTLVTHGGRDFRVPMAQGLATYATLQRLGVESEFLYFEDENHWILRPENSVVWHSHLISWMDRHLKPQRGGGSSE